MAGLSFTGKRILDIGAGTGALYDAICEVAADPDYFACDLSGEMLRQSAIPECRRAVGTVADVALPHESFDLIFMLGVSTYLAPKQLSDSLELIASRLSQGGLFVISFSNPRSLDWYVRSFIRRIWRGGGVIGQGFQTHGYLPSDVPEPLRLITAEWYNFSLTPLNTLLPGTSAWIAARADRHLPAAMKVVTCADIVARYSL